MEGEIGTRETPTDKDIPQQEKMPPEKSWERLQRPTEPCQETGSDSETPGEIEINRKTGKRARWRENITGRTQDSEAENRPGAYAGKLTILSAQPKAFLPSLGGGSG